MRVEEVGEQNRNKAQTKESSMSGMEHNAYRQASPGPSTYTKVRDAYA